MDINGVPTGNTASLEPPPAITYAAGPHTPPPSVVGACCVFFAGPTECLQTEGRLAGASVFSLPAVLTLGHLSCVHLFPRCSTLPAPAPCGQEAGAPSICLFVCARASSLGLVDDRWRRRALGEVEKGRLEGVPCNTLTCTHRVGLCCMLHPKKRTGLSAFCVFVLA